MEDVILKALTTAGIGGVIAALMFYFYRADQATHAKRQDEFITAVTEMNRQLLAVVSDNTKAMTALQSSTSSLQTVVTQLSADAATRDMYFREHVIPKLKGAA